MKLKKFRKLVLHTAIATLLFSIPVLSDARAGYRLNNYRGQETNYFSQTVTRPSNNYYTLTSNQYERLGTYNNYYLVSRGDYRRPLYNTRPNEGPAENPTPEPGPEFLPQEPQHRPQPLPQPELEPVQPAPLPNENFTSNRNHTLSGEEMEMLNYVNKARQDAGLRPLEIDPDLAYVARVKSQDMYDNNYFSHDSPSYGSPFNMMTSFGIQYRGVAENIAKNTSTAAAHNALMRSQGHKDNILNPLYTHIGIGIYKGYYTQMFINK